MSGERVRDMAIGWWRRRDRWPWVAILVALVYLWLQWAPALVPWPAEYEALPGDAGDNRLNLLFLEHAFRWLLGQEPLFDSGFYFPLANVGAFSDLLVGTVPPYAAMRLVGLDVFDSFRVWVAVGLLVDFGAAFVVARRFGLSGPGAILTAIVFSFAAPMAGQASHLQLLWRPYVPFAFWWAYQLAASPRGPARRLLHPVVMLLGWLAYGFVCSPVMALLTAFVALFLIVAIAGIRWAGIGEIEPLPATGGDRRPGLVVATATIAFGMIVAVGYWQASRDYAISRWFQGGASSPHLWSWLDGGTSVFWRPISELLPKVDFYWETQMFVGIGVVAAILYGLWQPRLHRWRVPLVVMLAIAVALLTVSARISIFVLLTQLPGLNAIRTPGRMILALLFPLGLLAASGLAVARARLPWKAFVAFAAVVLLDLAMVQVPFRHESTWRDGATIVADRARPLVEAPGSPAVLLDVIDTDADDRMRDLDAMLAARWLDVPSINGFSGFLPFEVPRGLDCGSAKGWLDELGSKLPPSWPRTSEGGTGSTVRVVVVDERGACEIEVTL